MNKKTIKLINIFNKLAKKHIKNARQLKKISKIGYLNTKYLIILNRIIKLLQNDFRQNKIFLLNGFYQCDLRKYPKICLK